MKYTTSTVFVALSALVQQTVCYDGALGPNPNPKRGLVHVPLAKYPLDDQIWIQKGSPLTWYYNYKTTPSASLAGGDTKLQFVPQLWGDYENTFVDDVKGLIANGYNISHVLGFNEPDNAADSGTGGSGITPENAAARWKSSIEPLAKLGIKLGTPAPTGAPAGLQWMKDFFAACKNCTFDFMPLHWYGSWDALAAHLGEYHGTFPNMTIWFTEFALDNAGVSDTQYFFNNSVNYFDRLDYVERYTYFGTFRSTCSNVGPNAALLNENGGLTYLGAWYMNKDASQAASLTGTAGTGSCTSTDGSNGAGKKSAGSRESQVVWGLILASFAGVLGGLLAL